MRILWNCGFLLTFFIVCTAAKKQDKFEGDFEFAEDIAEDKKRAGEKKTWIFDPESELCAALKCRKEEQCLLEDSYTAVCVNRADIKRNGDTVLPKSEVRFSSSSTPRSLEDDEDDYDDESSDNMKGSSSADLNENDGNNVDDDLGLEFYDLDGGEDEAKKKIKPTVTSTTTPMSAILRRCNRCPVVKPTYICGSDNYTYSSLCKLDYYNCMHNASIKVVCKGFCPCPTNWDVKKEKQAARLLQFENKFRATVNKENSNKPKVIFSPEVLKAKEEFFGKKKIKTTSTTSWTSLEDKQRQAGYNDVLPDKKEAESVQTCTDSALDSMGNRLLDWFSVLMSQPHKEKAGKVKSKGYFSSACAKEVEWMFGYLDGNGDALLSMQELYDLEHNDREKCLKPFLDKCDDNRDIFLTSSEWCRCFSKADRPCVAMRRRSKPGLLGAYMPLCDVEGFFQPTQCHSAIGTCWCVDKHGVEQIGTRTRGRPDCEGILKKNGLMKNSLDGNDIDDISEESNESDESQEGSGDY